MRTAIIVSAIIIGKAVNAKAIVHQAEDLAYMIIIFMIWDLVTDFIVRRNKL